MNKPLTLAALTAAVFMHVGCTAQSFNAANIAVTPYVYKETLAGREVYRLTMRTSSVWIDPVGARVVQFRRSDRAQMKAHHGDGDEIVFIENKVMDIVPYHPFTQGEQISLTPAAPGLAEGKYWMTYSNIGHLTFVGPASDGWLMTRDFHLLDNGALYITTTLQNRAGGRDVTVKVDLGTPDTAMVVDSKALAVTNAYENEVFMRFLVPTPSSEDFMQYNAGTPTGVNSVVDKGGEFPREVVEKAQFLVGPDAAKFNGFVIGPTHVNASGQTRFTQKWIIKSEGGEQAPASANTAAPAKPGSSSTGGFNDGNDYLNNPSSNPLP